MARPQKFEQSDTLRVSVKRISAITGRAFRAAENQIATPGQFGAGVLPLTCMNNAEVAFYVPTLKLYVHVFKRRRDTTDKSSQLRWLDGQTYQLGGSAIDLSGTGASDLSDWIN